MPTTTVNNAALGAVLLKTRQAKKLTQRKLAEMSDLHLATVQRAEAGDSKVDLDTLRALATALDLDLGLLVSIAA